MQTKILIVEDEPGLALLIISVLSRVNCDVAWARDGKKAMELATQRRFDLIALDTKLSDATGFEICSELKQRHISQKTPVLFISASALAEDIAEARKRGAVDYIIKPFDVTVLIDKVVYYSRVLSKEQKEFQHSWPTN